VRAYPNPYEALKGLTRTNEAIDKKSDSWFYTLDVTEESGINANHTSNFVGI
jgi:adenylosuccinate lyase